MRGGTMERIIEQLPNENSENCGPEIGFFSEGRIELKDLKRPNSASIYIGNWGGQARLSGSEIIRYSSPLQVTVFDCQKAITFGFNLNL
jgi:hypothetical protein